MPAYLFQFRHVAYSGETWDQLKVQIFGSAVIQVGDDICVLIDSLSTRKVSLHIDTRMVIQ